jgi:hypothetical protein
MERAHCGFGILGTETLGGFSEIGFGGKTIHPSWSFGEEIIYISSWCFFVDEIFFGSCVFFTW